MKWNRGRQKDSYVIKISVNDCYKILLGKNDKKLSKNLIEIIKDYVEVNDKFKEKHGRNFNTNVSL